MEASVLNLTIVLAVAQVKVLNAIANDLVDPGTGAVWVNAGVARNHSAAHTRTLVRLCCAGRSETDTGQPRQPGQADGNQADRNNHADQARHDQHENPGDKRNQGESGAALPQPSSAKHLEQHHDDCDDQQNVN